LFVCLFRGEYSREILGAEVPGSDKVREALLECLSSVLQLAGPWNGQQFLNIFNGLIKVFQLEKNIKSFESKIIPFGICLFFSFAVLSDTFFHIF
jgi:hypothetical protein